MYPYLAPLVVDPNNPNTAYQTNPFTNPSDFITHMPTAKMDMLATAGVDHLRLPVAPGPWLDCLVTGSIDETRIEALFVLLDAAVNYILGRGFGLEFDLHDSYYVKNMPPELLGSGPTSAIWLRRVEFTRRLCARYANRPTDKVSVSLFNEPLPAAQIIGGTWKANYEPTLYTAARGAMPNHTLILTSDNYSNIDTTIVSAPLSDKNVKYAVHVYEPFMFTNQGYKNGLNNWVTGMGWPPSTAVKATVTSNMNAAVDADGSVSDKTATKAAQVGFINSYFDTPQDIAWLKGRLALLSRWCDKNGLPRNRITVDEFGSTRNNALTNGALAAARVPFKNAILAAIKAEGFSFASFAIDADDYGETDGTGSTVGNLLSGINMS